MFSISIFATCQLTTFPHYVNRKLQLQSSQHLISLKMCVVCCKWDRVGFGVSEFYNKMFASEHLTVCVWDSLDFIVYFLLFMKYLTENTCPMQPECINPHVEQQQSITFTLLICNNVLLPLHLYLYYVKVFYFHIGLLALPSFADFIYRPWKENVLSAFHNGW